MYSEISLPVLEENQVDFRSFVEDFILELFQEKYRDHYSIEKYYKTANKEIYEDCLNKIQSGVPALYIRTRREDTEESNPEELSDWLVCRIEVLIAVPSRLDKGIKNVGRYSYIMNTLVRKTLRENFLTGLPRNRRRPFIYLGNRDVYRDDDLDILLSEYNVNYISF